jgi:hypothetical protein
LTILALFVLFGLFGPGERWRKEIFLQSLDQRIATFNSDDFSQAIWLGWDKIQRYCIDAVDNILSTR